MKTWAGPEDYNVPPLLEKVISFAHALIHDVRDIRVDIDIKMQPSLQPNQIQSILLFQILARGMGSYPVCKLT